MKRATLYAAALAAVLLWPPALPAQTPDAASAACRIDCGSCCIVDTDGCGNYLATTAAHVVGRNKTATIYIGGKEYTATVIDKAAPYCAGNDWAVLAFRADEDLPVVPLSRVRPLSGDDAKVWSAGFPAARGERSQQIKTGEVFGLNRNGGLVLDYWVAGGTSGAPVFNHDGVVGIITHADDRGRGSCVATPLLAMADPPADESIDEAGLRETGLFGRRNRGGDRGPDGCDKGEGKDDPDGPVKTPAIMGSARRLVEIEKGVAANGEGINQLGAMLAEHEARRQAAVDAEAARLAAENAADTVEREDATDYTLPGLALVGVLFAVGAVVASLRSGKEAVVGHFQTVLTE